ncbi:sodium/proton antiporter NhaA [Helicobacter sp. 13S00477-4]|uniref:sodium/proton antiporter NhaA n=1 Tax=Helicobacter sp. 13S00477-4 TaxID=1905759 RepID=UPI000BA59FA0|nr:sodium/proton antiporter NhaA [Helicobacter sp. 13S00477-4]PAF51031.1 Na+/H+ antiporter NhaA [Helicobacter sp. 13S00477-4]
MNKFEKPLQTSLINVFLSFIKSESFGGIFLFISAVLAMVIANSTLNSYYFDFWHTEFGFQFGEHFVGFSIHHWINDVLMALFFLMVGLEIKREILFGELAGFKKAAFPAIAALGGMIAPGLIYYLLNAGSESSHGFGIPMATDIAFALGVIMLLGKRVPIALKVFLVTLAVADDLGAIIIIAVFYTTGLKLLWLLCAIGVVMILILLNKMNIKNLIPYMVLGVLLWFTIHNSGIHATIAAVILAFCIPISPKKQSKDFSNLIKTLGESFQSKTTKEQYPTEEEIHTIKKKLKTIQSPLGKLEHTLQPWCAYFIMPLFAFANAGVNIGGDINFNIDHILLGVVLGLVIGKPLGIFIITFLCEKIGIATRPKGINWGHILGAGMLAGIGFTMSMFVSNLAFSHPESMEVSKIAILGGSLISGMIGVVYLIFLSKINPKEK